MKKEIKQGDVVVFEPNNFNPEYWDNLSESDRVKYYGYLGYGSQRLKTFVFITRINNEDGYDSGHCVLIALDNKKIETMVHTDTLRKATFEEF